MTQFKTYGAPKQVLGIVQAKVALGVFVSDEGVTADSSGRKIILAGTPVGGDVSAYADENAVLKVANDATAQGILEFDVDVTSGQGTGTLIIHGYINEFRLPDDLTISDEAKKAIPDVVFFKRNE
jgi:hypothetical protein